MVIIATILNLPWTFLGILLALASVPAHLSFRRPGAMVIRVRSFWWQSWLKGRKGVRAMSIGSVVILGGNLLENDLEHEIIHVEQALRRPFIHPVLYMYQSLRYGYRQNKYEIEAYEKARNKYIS